ncbi:MAG: hypothetical protein CO113_01325 [Elusimicrobia bacterium CG_4_9_14_3_um_filter_62_55]|nr:MAG: hypothetical protein COR54_14810 [Elusimicrobia bacterium CG22_combo_CG10-13_8_21_14_all_63_91]PJA12172.1 MAG: hypothetical protein COX66_18005 [Elusimicrobia bacterium CG_4_10_14_0_2_um_filter_63_34]PJB26912.1 MAG: hypothetical protein CO113_01325 [Elusimicrobia bacterium CG_4_9_14_3_um_filter_62_55]
MGSDELAVEGFDDGWPCMLNTEGDFKYEETPCELYYRTPVDFQMFNGVARNAYPTLDAARSSIRKRKASFQAFGVRALWWLDHRSGPPGLERVLEEEGMQRIEDAIPMTRPLSAETAAVSRPPGAEIREVDSEARLGDFLDVLSDSYGIDDENILGVYRKAWRWALGRITERLHSYVLYEDGRPVSCTQLIQGFAGRYGLRRDQASGSSEIVAPLNDQDRALPADSFGGGRFQALACPLAENPPVLSVSGTLRASTLGYFGSAGPCSPRLDTD